MDDPMAQTLIQSVPDLNENYTSQSEYVDDAMDGTVYLLTKAVLSSILEDNLLPTELIEKIE